MGRTGPVSRISMCDRALSLSLSAVPRTRATAAVCRLTVYSTVISVYNSAPATRGSTHVTHTSRTHRHTARGTQPSFRVARLAVPSRTRCNSDYCTRHAPWLSTALRPTYQSMSLRSSPGLHRALTRAAGVTAVVPSRKRSVGTTVRACCALAHTSHTACVWLLIASAMLGRRCLTPLSPLCVRARCTLCWSSGPDEQ